MISKYFFMDHYFFILLLNFTFKRGALKMNELKVISNFKTINIKPLKTLEKRLNKFSEKGYKIAETNIEYNLADGGRILLEKR